MNVTKQTSLEKREPIWRWRMRSIRSEVEELVLPDLTGTEVAQGEERAEVVVKGRRHELRFHDYPEIFNIPGLYEELFYERLGCDSPRRVAHLLKDALEEKDQAMSSLRVLDIGAGNGMVGDELRALGVQNVVGVDVLPEARDAAMRDRPGVYADYIVADLNKSTPEQERILRARNLNCLTMVAAMGVQDIQAGTLVKGLDLLEAPAWAAFTVREDILKDEHESGFGKLMQALEESGTLVTEVFWRYRHRFLATGEPVYYGALVVRKL